MIDNKLNKPMSTDRINALPLISGPSIFNLTLFDQSELKSDLIAKTRCPICTLKLPCAHFKDKLP